MAGLCVRQAVCGRSVCGADCVWQVCVAGRLCVAGMCGRQTVCGRYVCEADTDSPLWH